MALFMVLGTIALLSVLVTEYMYVSSFNQKLAYDSLDQVQAYYTAKSGLKISLLRLMAYQRVKGFIGQTGAAQAVPRNQLDQLWKFELQFPLPSALALLMPSQKEAIEKFQKDSTLPGKFTAKIESESTKFNINSILEGFSAPSVASPSPSPTAGASPSPSPSPGASPGGVAFDSEQARKALREMVQQVYQAKIQTDPDFGNEYRDLRWEDFMDQMIGWADMKYDVPRWPRDLGIPRKMAPYYSVSELHLLPLMDDRLYDLFSPIFTVVPTTGINVNTLQEPMLRALFPQVRKEEVDQFFKYRDDTSRDNSFKTTDEFFQWCSANISSVRGGSLSTAFEQRGLRLVVDEQAFKIRVEAQVNNTRRIIEADVVLTPPKKPGSAPGGGTPGYAGFVAGGSGFSQNKEGPARIDPGFRITFMRFY